VRRVEQSESGICPRPGNGGGHGSLYHRVYHSTAANGKMVEIMKTKRFYFWGLFWATLGLLYFFVPLYGTFDFSLREIKGTLSFEAYRIVLSDPQFLDSFRYSATMGVITVLASLLIFLPTVYWVHLKVPQLRPVIEIITILPLSSRSLFMCLASSVPSATPLQLTLHSFTTDILMLAGYVVLSMPYMYRALDVGMRSIDIRTLTEAAQSLGSNWLQALIHVIIPIYASPS